MATRLYLRGDILPSVDAPSAGEKSTALPAGTANGTTPTSYHMSPVEGSSQTSVTVTTLAQTTSQTGCLARFVSNRLPSGTISANTWTFFYASDESNGAANMFLSLSIYVWNTSSGIVRGFIYDNASGLGTEWATSQSAQSITVSGNAVTGSAGDLLVCEVWYNSVQAMATAYTGSFYWNGTDDTTTGTGNASTASYLETPQNINLRLPKSSTIFIM